jgi:hypothetical protein
VSVYRRRIRLACVVLTDGMSPTQRPIGQQSPQSVATSSACEPHRCAPWRPAGGRDTRRSATKGVGWRLSGRSCATRSAANVPDMRLPGRRGSLHDAVGYAGATPGVSGTHVRRRGGSGGAAMQEGAPVSGGTGGRPGPTPAHRQRLRTTATAFVATCATVDSTRPTRSHVVAQSPGRGPSSRARRFAVLTRLNSAFRPRSCSTVRIAASVCTPPPWHCRCSVRPTGAGVPMLAGASRSSHRHGVPRDLLGPRSPGRAGRSFHGTLSWIVPNWLNCPVLSAAARRWRSSRRYAAAGAFCGVHSVGPFGLSISRLRQPIRHVGDRVRPVIDASPVVGGARRA